MKELIVVNNDTIGGSEIKTVNARDLHRFLEIGKDFSNWIKKQIERARLVEGRDYVKVAQKGEREIIGQFPIEYHLTLEAGKHIAMLSNTEKGFEVREYFIECEKVALAAPIDPIKVLNDPSAMRGLLLTYSEKVLALEDTILAQAPTVAAFDLISSSDGLLNLTNAAKTIQIQPQKTLNPYLIMNGWVYRRAGSKGLVAYQGKIQQGLLVHKVRTVPMADGTEKITEQVMVTPKGLAKLAKVFGVEAAA